MKKILVKWKMNLRGKNDQFVGLKSKMDSRKHVDDEENKTGKGVNSDDIKNRKHEESFV